MSLINLTKKLKIIDKLIITLFLVLVFSLIIIRRWLPVNTLIAYFDDGLFVSRAEFILNGNLGKLNSGFNALVKGTVYPWFIVISKIAGLSPIFLSYLFLILNATLLSFFIYKLTNRIYLSFILSCFIIADPVYFTDSASRIMREQVQQNFILLFFVLFNLLIYLISKKELGTKKIIVIFALLGGIFVVALNVREENIWIYSALIINILLIFPIKIDHKKRFLIFLTLFISIFISIHAVRLVNNIFYGVSLQNNTTEGEFPKMMLNLSSIQTDSGNIRYVSIDKNKRELAYKASPTFSKLESNLEGPGQAWIQFGCNDSQTCDDYANGWFHVALREAMKEQGWWDSESIAQNQMKKVNQEIEGACERNLITCKKGIPFGPAYGNQFISQQEVIDANTYFFQYTNQSFNSWSISRNLEKDTILKTEVMPEDMYQSWRKTIPSMPPAQITYINKFNSRYLEFQPFLNIWTFVYSNLLKLFFAINILILFYAIGNKILRKKFLHFWPLYLSFFYIWISKGALLSLNSSINFKSVGLTYALSSRAFLTGFLAIGIIIFSLIITEKKVND